MMTAAIGTHRWGTVQRTFPQMHRDRPSRTMWVDLDLVRLGLAGGHGTRPELGCGCVVGTVGSAGADLIGVDRRMLEVEANGLLKGSRGRSRTQTHPLHPR
jgi:hypothetical protein